MVQMDHGVYRNRMIAMLASNWRYFITHYQSYIFLFTPDPCDEDCDPCGTPTITPKVKRDVSRSGDIGNDGILNFLETFFGILSTGTHVHGFTLKFWQYFVIVSAFNLP